MRVEVAANRSERIEPLHAQRADFVSNARDPGEWILRIMSCGLAHCFFFKISGASISTAIYRAGVRFLKTPSRQGPAPARAMVWISGEAAIRIPLRATLRTMPGCF